MTIDELINELVVLKNDVSGSTKVTIEVDDPYYNGIVNNPYIQKYGEDTFIILSVH